MANYQGIQKRWAESPQRDDQLAPARIESDAKAELQEIAKFEGKTL